MENSQISDNNCERKGPFHEGKAGMPEFLATHLTAVAQDHQDRVFSAETGRGGKVGGQLPQSLGRVRSSACCRLQKLND